jgi:hypothetical protein
MSYCEECSSYDCGCFEMKRIAELEQQLTEREKQIAAKDALYHELLMAVESKWPGESRHQTALRYIKQSEHRIFGIATSYEQELGK